MTTLSRSAPSTSINRSFSRPQTVFDKSRYIAVMDSNGLWREMPISSLASIPHAVRIRITPAVANKVLEERNRQNRSINRRRVQKYASDIVSGHWKVHGNGIQFNQEGTLIDGQTRLSAVILANTPADFMVTFGVEDDAVCAIDEGRARSNLDVAKIMGIEGASKFSMSMAAYLLEYNGVKDTRSRLYMIEFYERHREALSFVEDRLKARGLQKAPVGAVLVRAYYYCRNDLRQLEKLERFLYLLQLNPTDFASQGIKLSPEEITPVSLREFLDRNKDRNTGPARAELYRKTQSAVWNFLHGIAISKIYGMKDEKFPLPEEEVNISL